MPGGTSVRGILRLSTTAPPGARISFRSGNATLVPTPRLINLSAGQTSANISVATRRVTRMTNVVVTTTYRGPDGATSSDSVTLTLRP